MSYTIALQMPENLYEALRLQAVKHGQTPEALATEWLVESLHHAETVEEDPLVKLFGTIQGDVSDVAERHDYYMGQAIFQELRDGG